MMRRVRREFISSKTLMCGGGVRSILLLPLVSRCLETMDVCIWRMFVILSVVSRHADMVCLCLVCILWQQSMLRSA